MSERTSLDVANAIGGLTVSSAESSDCIAVAAGIQSAYSKNSVTAVFGKVLLGHMFGDECPPGVNQLSTAFANLVSYFSTGKETGVAAESFVHCLTAAVTNLPQGSSALTELRAALGIH
jgi:hypothetical protein